MIITAKNQPRNRSEFGATLSAVAADMEMPLDSEARAILIGSLRCTESEWMSDPAAHKAAEHRGRLLLLHAPVVGFHQCVDSIDGQTMAAVAEVVDHAHA